MGNHGGTRTATARRPTRAGVMARGGSGRGDSHRRAAWAREMVAAADRVEDLRDRRDAYLATMRARGAAPEADVVEGFRAEMTRSHAEYTALRRALGLPPLRALGPLPRAVGKGITRRAEEQRLRAEWRRTADPERFAELDALLRRRAARRQMFAERDRRAKAGEAQRARNRPRVLTTPEGRADLERRLAAAEGRGDRAEAKRLRGQLRQLRYRMARDARRAAASGGTATPGGED